MNSVMRVPDRLVLDRELEECSSWWFLDRLIVPTVAGLRARGVPTTQSCHGHMTYGCHWPWVMVNLDGLDAAGMHRTGNQLVRSAYGATDYPDDEVAIEVMMLRPDGPLYLAPGYATAGGAAIRWWRSIAREDGLERLLHRGRVEMSAFAGFLADGRPVSAHRSEAEDAVTEAEAAFDLEAVPQEPPRARS